MKVKELVNDAGDPVTISDIQEYEKQTGLRLPTEVKELLCKTNGGRFMDNALLKYQSWNIPIEGFCRISSEHLWDIDRCRKDVEDTTQDINWIPFIYCASGDYIVHDNNSVNLWDHESGELVEVCETIEQFFSKVKFESILSPFERFCATKRLKNFYDSPFVSDEDLVCQQAAAEGNLLLVKDCCEAGLNKGKALKAAAMNGHAGILDYLLSIGFDLNETDEQGKTILDWLHWKPEYYEIVKGKGGKLASEL